MTSGDRLAVGSLNKKESKLTDKDNNVVTAEGNSRRGIDGNGKHTIKNNNL